MPIILKLNCSKIPKERLFQGKNGKYIDLVLFENKVPDQHGNHGFISVSVTKEERLAGTRGEIVGNWKDTSRDREQQKAPQPRRPAPPKPPKPEPKPRDPTLDAGLDDDDDFNF